MTFFAFIPLIWLFVVASVLAYQVRKFRRKGMTGGQALEEAIKSTAVKRPPAAPPSAGALVLFGLVGGVCLLASLGIFFSTFIFIHGAAQTSGQLVGFVRHRNSKGSDTFSPQVRFMAPSGEIIVFASKTSSGYSAWPSMGSPVNVYFDPRNPHRARMALFMDLWFVPIFLFCFGGIFLAVSKAASHAQKPKAPVPPPPSSPGRSGSAGYDIPTIIR